MRRLLRDARGTDVCLEQRDDADPFDYAREWLKRHRVAPLPAGLRFGGGLVGYFGYESVRHIEPRALRRAKPDPLGTPDMLLLVSDELAVVDNVLGKLYLVVYADPRAAGCATRRAQERVARLRSRLALPLPEALAVIQPAEAQAQTEALRAHVHRSRLSRGREALEGVHLRRRLHAGADLPARLARRSTPRRSSSTARCAGSIRRRTCSTSTSATTTWSARRRRSWCGWRATR